MRCEHFEREGLLRQEEGRPDPHVDGCEDCRAARATYLRITEALGDVGADLRPRQGWEEEVLTKVRAAPPAPSDPPERVLRSLDAPTRRRRTWLAAGVGLALLAAALIVFLLRPRDAALVASIERVPSGAVVRAGGAEWASGDGIWAISEAGGAVWVYRDGRLKLTCTMDTIAPPRCVLHGAGVRAWEPTRVGRYHVFAFRTPPPAAAPPTYDQAKALLSRHDGAATELPIIVR